MILQIKAPPIFNVDIYFYLYKMYLEEISNYKLDVFWSNMSKLK